MTNTHAWLDLHLQIESDKNMVLAKQILPFFFYKNDRCTLQFHKHKWFKAHSASNSQVEAIL